MSEPNDDAPPPPPPQEPVTDPGPPQDVPPQELYSPQEPPAFGVGSPDMPLVPHDASLADAVGVPSPSARRRKAADERLGRETDDDGEPISGKRSRRATTIIALSVVGGLSIAGLVFLGHANAERYVLTCDSSKVTAEQGRAFPPWGTHPLTGPEWKPIQLPTNAECKPRETEELDEIGSAYLAILIDRASATLAAKNPLDVPATAAGQQAAASPLDAATEQLNQALLLARSPERRDQRKEIERLLGDIDYWRASVRLRDASAALLDAAKQFDTAAAKRPRHVTDAAAWGSYLRRLADELHAGPNGATPTAPTAPLPAGSVSAPAEPAPAGTALPVEPDTAGSAAPAVDAGVPSGGVLL